MSCVFSNWLNISFFVTEYVTYFYIYMCFSLQVYSMGGRRLRSTHTSLAAIIKSKMQPLKFASLPFPQHQSTLRRTGTSSTNFRPHHSVSFNKTLLIFSLFLCIYKIFSHFEFSSIFWLFIPYGSSSASFRHYY